MDKIIDYIIDEALILGPVLYVIGMLLKSTPNVRDWVIPWVLLALGIIGGVLLIVRGGGDPVDGIIQGVLVAGLTVLTNQLIKQTTEKE